MDFERDNIVRLCFGTFVFSIFFIAICVCTLVFTPAEETAEVPHFMEEDNDENENSVAENVDYENLLNEEYPQIVLQLKKTEDTGLVLYRQDQTKTAVEWYYTRITNSRDVAQAILASADKYNIPLSLAFALAYTESRYKVNAMHKNINGTVDRGLFQLNNTSFPKLSESDYYDPKISAYYGLSHLRFCLNTAGNEIAALAMYNAGSSKVRKNNTPQTTLNYISSIQSYKDALDEAFAAEVLALYNPDMQTKLLAKKD